MLPAARKRAGETPFGAQGKPALRKCILGDNGLRGLERITCWVDLKDYEREGRDGCVAFFPRLAGDASGGFLRGYRRGELRGRPSRGMTAGACNEDSRGCRDCYDS